MTNALASFLAAANRCCAAKSAASAQSNCRQKQKRKPCAPADESGYVSKKQPGHAGDGENDERRNSPTTISPARTPGAGQDGKRRNDRDE